MRMMIATSLAALLAAGSAPVTAQVDTGSEKVNAIIVYGDDKCPEPTSDEIINVCARKPERERYRIPQGLRQTPSANSESWNSRVLAYERVGKTGTLSCTPTGPGGWTGCSQKLIDAAYAEKKGSADVSFAKIIDDERAKRLVNLDADAAATQSRVEQVEKEQEAKRRAEAEAAEKAQAPAPTPTPSPSGN